MDVKMLCVEISKDNEKKLNDLSDVLLINMAEVVDLLIKNGYHNIMKQDQYRDINK